MSEFKVGDVVIDCDDDTPKKIEKFINRENGVNVILEGGFLAHITNITHHQKQ